ncbi:restriction endonuclease subunit S [Falsibacillus pallidus]|uniref:Type I restriction enzyme S subunit n=1 Tax=Falsibacillus pallidus TaxID=493781 RepID=A0A370GLC3_9BACI|nr:restriction endonuclease subunit S [Falsibacillus pallidus]RDI44056.1 type I restriction enzyme S subunit [Falsibacillus pallidus]
MNKYPSYIDSGKEWLREIPSHWGLSKVKYIGDYINGYAFKPTEWSDTGLKIIRIQNLTDRNANFNYYSGRKISDKYLIKKGDILLSWSASLGVHFWMQEEALLNQHIFKVIPNEKLVEKNFYYWLAKCFINEMEKDTHGSTMTHLTKDKFGSFEVPLPPLSEQSQIADFLKDQIEKIDNIILKQQQVIERMKEYRISLITEIITKGLQRNVPMKKSNVPWIGDIPEHWEIKKFKHKFYIKKEINQEKDPVVLSLTQKGLKIKDLTSNEGQHADNYSKYQRVELKDFVMNMMDLLTGWVDSSPYEGVTSPDYRVFVQKNKEECHDYYLYYFKICYLSKIFFGHGQGVSTLGRWRLQTDVFKNFPIMIPPIQEQFEIVKYIEEKTSNIDSLIDKIDGFIRNAEVYKKALIFEVVTGKIDVRNYKKSIMEVK